MKSIFTVFLLLFTLNLSLAQITVTGTGCSPIGSDVDAIYNLNGTQNGKNRYLTTDNFHQIEWTGTQWIFDFGGSQILFTNNTDVGADPPATGWSTGLNSCAGSSAPTLSGDVGTLPVELTFFKARISNFKVILLWQTATELNNEKFEVEISKDGREFQKIGVIKGNGTTIASQEYSFEVKNPKKGVSYYRLKQIDFDGQFEYSEVISLRFIGENQEVGIFYPNPSKTGVVNLDYISQTNKEIDIAVYDITAKIVINQVRQVSSGSNNLIFDFSTLNTGIYIAQISDARNSTRRKLIIK